MHISYNKQKQHTQTAYKRKHTQKYIDYFRRLSSSSNTGGALNNATITTTHVCYEAKQDHKFKSFQTNTTQFIITCVCVSRWQHISLISWTLAVHQRQRYMQYESMSADMDELLYSMGELHSMFTQCDHWTKAQEINTSPYGIMQWLIIVASSRRDTICIIEDGFTIRGPQCVTSELQYNKTKEFKNCRWSKGIFHFNPGLVFDSQRLLILKKMIAYVK